MHQESSGMGSVFQVRTILICLMASMALHAPSAAQDAAASPTPNPYPTLTIPSPVRTPEATPTPGAEATPTPTATPEQPKSWNLTGLVVNAATGAPVRRAAVLLAKREVTPESTTPGSATLTDADGRFQFAGLPQGGVLLVVRKPGFFTQQELQHPELFEAELFVPPGSDPVVVSLTPAGKLSGVVSDANGETVEGVRLRLLQTTIFNGHKVWQKKEIAKTTNEDGEFKISGLQPGTYRLATELTRKPRITLGRSLGRTTAQTVYSASYYPNVTDVASSASIEVTSGQTSNVSLTLHEEPAYSVSGTVSGYPKGQTVSFQVLNGFDDALSIDMQFDSQSGKFQFGPLPAGVYRIHARSQDARGRWLYAIAPINVRGAINDARVLLRPMLTIPVVFQLQSRRKPEQLDSYPVDAEIFSPRSLPEEGRSFIDKGSDHGSDSGQLPLAIRDVEPGRYMVELHPQDGWYIYSASYGSLDLFRDPIQVGARPETIEIALRNDGATLKGTVQSSGKGAKGTVFLIRNNSPALSPTMLGTNEKGEFQANNVAPGDYTALALDHINGLEYANSEAMQPYLARGTHIKLGANDQSNITLELIRRTE